MSCSSSAEDEEVSLDTGVVMLDDCEHFIQITSHGDCSGREVPRHAMFL